MPGTAISDKLHDGRGPPPHQLHHPASGGGLRLRRTLSAPAAGGPPATSRSGTAACRRPCLILIVGSLLAMLPGCRGPSAPGSLVQDRPEPPSASAADPPAPPAEIFHQTAAALSEESALRRLPQPRPVDQPQEVLPLPQEVLPLPQEVSLELADVIQSVYESYPLLEAVLHERAIAEGKELTAWGEFDRSLKAYSLADPLGYYERYRMAVKLDQPLPGGGSVYSGYKLGRGSFHPAWYDDQTNRGGEFSLGMGVPLLQGRLIDKRRSGLSQAALARQALEPAIQVQLLEFVRQASQAYWIWVAAGQILETQRQQLQLARDRAQQIEQRVQSGDLESIARLDNQRLIASREVKLIDAERKLQMAAIKLSLFLRTSDGQPLLPDAVLLPGGFPAPETLSPRTLTEQIRIAWAARPDLVELDLLAQQVDVELAEAENMLLPKMDAILEVSQDVGAATVDKRSKSPFELEAGLYGEVPLQRRAARGKIGAARGKLAQLRAKREFTADKIAAEVQDAVSALEAAAAKLERTEQNLELSRQSLALSQEAFNAGDIDLIILNIYEQAVADAQIAWIESLAEYFLAQADYRAAMAGDPFRPPEAWSP